MVLEEVGQNSARYPWCWSEEELQISEQKMVLGSFGQSGGKSSSFMSSVEAGPRAGLGGVFHFAGCWMCIVLVAFNILDPWLRVLPSR